MEGNGTSTYSEGGIIGGHDIVMLIFTDVRVIGPIGGRIKLPLVSGVPTTVHNDIIIATNGILAFSLNAIISFKIQSATLITTKFIMIYRNSTSTNFSTFLNHDGAILK